MVKARWLVDNLVNNELHGRAEEWSLSHNGVIVYNGGVAFNGWEVYNGVVAYNGTEVKMFYT